MKFLKQISLNELLSTLIIASAAFLLLGTITALWNNSFFIRMTEVNGWDYIILSFESLLIGLFFGIQAPHCATKKAGIGGVLGFVGFGCSVCNKFFYCCLDQVFCFLTLSRFGIMPAHWVYFCFPMPLSRDGCRG